MQVQVFKFISGKSLKFFFDAKSYGKRFFFETSDFLKLDGMHELDVRREDSAGVLLLVVPDGMIFPNGDAKNYTSVPIPSL